MSLRSRSIGGGPRLVCALVACVGVACSGGATGPAVPVSGGGAPDVETTTTAADGSSRNEGILTEDAVGSVDVWTWIGQQRHLEGTRRVVVPVQFLTDEVVIVTSIALRTPQFEPIPPEPKDSRVHPGRKVALQVDHGPARCGPLPDGRPEVELTVRTGEAAPVDLVLPVPAWLLDELRERECTVAALAEAVTVRFGSFGEPSGISVGTEVVVERGETEEPIVIERMAGSVLLTMAPRTAGTPVTRLGAAENEASIPVDVTATRCDAHGLAGSQKTFVFSVWVSVGDGLPVYVELRPEPRLEEAMRATIDACIRAGG